MLPGNYIFGTNNDKPLSWIKSILVIMLWSVSFLPSAATRARQQQQQEQKKRFKMVVDYYMKVCCLFQSITSKLGWYPSWQSVILLGLYFILKHESEIIWPEWDVFSMLALLYLPTKKKATQVMTVSSAGHLVFLPPSFLHTAVRYLQIITLPFGGHPPAVTYFRII